MRLPSSPSAGKVKGMRQMINALTASILPVLNAMLIVLLFHCIFAVLGVKLFGTGGVVEDTSEEEEEEEEAKAFDTFLSGMLTLFQSATLDNWGEIAERANKSSMLFFVVFIIIITYVSAVEVTVE